MNTFEPAQLDNVCPHPIESKELLKWTSLDKLEHDFALLRDETNRVSTRIKKGLGPFEEPAEKECRELAEIFVIPANTRKTATDIIDIRLCAHIRALEFTLKKMRIILNHNRLVRLLNSLSRPPSIFSSFDHAEDTPDVRWFFKNRVMIFLLRVSLIRYWNHNIRPNSILLYPEHDRFKILENPRLYIEEDDCYVIMKDIVFPQLKLIISNHNGCQFCDISADTCCFFQTSSHYLDSMRSLVNRHGSFLERSIQFCMERLLRVDQTNQAKLLLYILSRVDHDRKEWKIINAILARLLSDSTIGFKAFGIRLFANLVEWNSDRDGNNFEMLSEHFDTMIELLESSSDEIRDAIYYTWESIGRLVYLTASDYRFLRVVVSSYIRRIDRIIQSRSFGIQKEYNTFCWLIMPRVIDDTGKFDFTSASDQLFEDLKMLTQKEAILGSFYNELESVSIDYEDSLMSDEKITQLDLIRDRATWLLVKQLSANSSRSSRGREGLMNYVESVISGGRRDQRSEYFSHANYLYYCGLLLEIRQCFYDRDQILEPRRYLWFLRVLELVGPYKENEDKLKAIESCLLRAIEILPRWKSQFISAAKHLSKVHKSQPLPPIYGLVYHNNRIGRKKPSSKKFKVSSDDMQGIQSRRISLISLCQCLIVDSDDAALDYMTRIIDLLGKLELAYKLRSERESPEQGVDLSLMPTCAELAFPTPLDNPNNPMYICEFAYFKDTMDYLRRNEPRELDYVCSRLHEEQNKRLEYYWNGYNKFDICCSSRVDKSRVRFRCIHHKIARPMDPQICPLLNRYQYRDCIESKNS